MIWMSVVLDPMTPYLSSSLTASVNISLCQPDRFNTQFTPDSKSHTGKSTIGQFVV
jgi:hypothetical protein